MKIERIVVSCDLSDASRKAFPAATSLAKRFSATLTVLHLAELPHPQPGAPKATLALSDGNLHAYLNALEEDLRAFVHAARADFDGVEPRIELIRGGGMDAYCEYLVDEKIELAVVSTHGRRGLSRMLLGGFATELLRHAPCPVLVCRATDGAAVAVEPRTILVPTDFSANNRPALDAAAGLARSFDARARLLHVIEYEPSLYGIARDLAGTWREFEDSVTEDFSRRFREFVERECGIQAELEIQKGNPIKRILEEIEEGAADLVVVGTHGRTGWDRLLIGSVAEQVTRRASCPVLVVRGQA